MVMAQSLFMLMKKTEPDCHIDVLAPAWTFSLLDRMPEVAQAIAMPLTHGQFGLTDRIKLGRQLKAKTYDQAIVLPNSWKSALIPFFAAIPLRTGYIGECRWGLLNDARSLDKQKLTMTVQRFVALGLPKHSEIPPEYAIPKLVVEQPRQQAVAEKFGLTGSARILALCPGAEYGPAKRWPASYYAEVARQKIEQGWQVWLLGSVKDKDSAEQINNETAGLCVDFTGGTSLAEVVDLMSLVDAVVTNDSGLMHVAAALDKKIIALYGSSDPGFTPPLNVKARIISLNLNCSPCFQRDCPLYPIGHKDHVKCLTGIQPKRVLDLLGG
jgi:heptosyltransferase-2